MIRRNFLKATLALSIVGRADAKPAGSNRPGLTFGVIADPQYADQPTRGSRFYRNSLEKLKLAVTELNKHKLDWVITLGDVIDKELKSFADIMPIYDALKAPHRLVFGNHDFEVADADKGKVQAAMNMAQPYYSESHKAWRLIFLDGTEVATYRYPKTDPRNSMAEGQLKRYQDQKLGNAFSWNSAVSNEQLNWLNQELVASQRARQRALVFCHFPVLPAGEAHNLWNANDVVQLIEKHPHVAAYMNGHNHSGNYAAHHGCHFVNFKGMVETENQTAYAVVQCFDDRIEIDGYGLEPDQKLD